MTQGLKWYNKECPDDMKVQEWERNIYHWSDIDNLLDLLTGLADAVLFEHLDQRVRLQDDVKALLGACPPQTGIGQAAIITAFSKEEIAKYMELKETELWL